MCGRYSLTQPPEAVRELFGYPERPNFPPRYNIAPTQPIAVVRHAGGGPSFALMRWGLIPAWVKDPAEFSILINARAESAATKPAFRNAFRRRRCLIPADGFYEWQRAGSGPKLPHLVRRPDRAAFAFAGLWETWHDREGGEIDSAVILTTDANAALAPLHARMPVVIGPEDFGRWLDADAHGPDDVADLPRPAPEDFFEAFPISTRVNRVANDDPAIHEPLADSATPPARAPGPAARGRPKPRDDGGQMEML